MLAFALLYFFDDSGMFALLLPAVIVHEAGHALFLRLGGLRVIRVSLGIFGLEMDYNGRLCGFRGAAAIAAGPISGFVYSMLCMLSPAQFWRLSGSISIVLSVFNLLPVLPLDGGRLLECAMGDRAKYISRGISLALCGVGFFLWLSLGWFSLFIMGAWLAWYNFLSLRYPE